MITNDQLVLFNKIRKWNVFRRQLNDKTLDLKEYQHVVKSTWVSVESTSPELAKAYCALGIGGEAGEVLDWVKKSLTDFHSKWKGYDFKKHMLNELEGEFGDLLWYVTALITLYELDISKILYRNALKTLGGNIKVAKVNYANSLKSSK